MSNRNSKVDFNKLPYKLQLSENELPKQWYNLRADMKNKPAPLLSPATMKPITFEELRQVFCDECARQELDEVNAFFDIPQAIQDFYKMYRPAPLTHAVFLENALNTPGEYQNKLSHHPIPDGHIRRRKPDGVRQR